MYYKLGHNLEIIKSRGNGMKFKEKTRLNRHVIDCSLFQSVFHRHVFH